MEGRQIKGDEMERNEDQIVPKSSKTMWKIEIEHSKLLIRHQDEALKIAKQDAVYKVVAACEREEGIGRDEIFQTLQSEMSKKDLDDALEFLSSEGHVYSTIDEDHFKTTES